MSVCWICSSDDCNEENMMCPSCEKNVVVLPDFLYWLADKRNITIDKEFIDNLVAEYNVARGHSWWTR